MQKIYEYVEPNNEVEAKEPKENEYLVVDLETMKPKIVKIEYSKTITPCRYMSS